MKIEDKNTILAEIRRHISSARAGEDALSVCTGVLMCLERARTLNAWDMMRVALQDMATLDAELGNDEVMRFFFCDIFDNQPDLWQHAPPDMKRSVADYLGGLRGHVDV